MLSAGDSLSKPICLQTLRKANVGKKQAVGAAAKRSRLRGETCCEGKPAARGNLLRGAPSDPVSLRVFNLKEWFVYIDEETQRLALMIKP